LYSPNLYHISMLGLRTGKWTKEFYHSNAGCPIDVLSRDWRTFVTIAEDAVLRVWDRTRPAGPTVLSLAVNPVGNGLRHA
jgi:hypothetical protein